MRIFLIIVFIIIVFFFIISYKKVQTHMANIAFTKGDYSIAEKYWLIASSKGDTEAQLNLAIFYNDYYTLDLGQNRLYLEDGFDLEKISSSYESFEKDKFDEKRNELIEKYLKLASDGGSSKAQLALGGFYKNKYFFSDLPEKYWLLASEQGEVKAQYELGFFYKMRSKYDLAEKYWLLASEQGDMYSQYELGILYADQDKYDLAEKYWLLAVRQGIGFSFEDLARAYYIEGKKELGEICDKIENERLVNNYEEARMKKIIRHILKK